MNVHSRAIIAILISASEIREICEEQLATHVYTLSNHICIPRQKTIRNMLSNKELSELRSKFRTLNKKLNLANKRCNKTSNPTRLYIAILHANHTAIRLLLSHHSVLTSMRWAVIIIIYYCGSSVSHRQTWTVQASEACSSAHNDCDAFTTPSRTTVPLRDTILYRWNPLAADDVSRKHSGSTTLECRPRWNNEVNDVTLRGFR